MAAETAFACTVGGRGRAAPPALAAGNPLVGMGRAGAGEGEVDAALMAADAGLVSQKE